jgi:putative membrane protein
MLRHINLFTNIFTHKDEIILRDYLALERTKLANERTLLAYIRSSLYMILGGIAFLQLKDFEGTRWVGYATLGVSVVILLIGIYRYLQIKYRLRNYYYKKKEEPSNPATKE